MPWMTGANRVRIGLRLLLYLSPYKFHSNLVHIPIQIPPSLSYKYRAHPIQIPSSSPYKSRTHSHTNPALIPYKQFLQILRGQWRDDRTGTMATLSLPPLLSTPTPVSTHPPQYLPVVIHPLYDLSLL